MKVPKIGQGIGEYQWSDEHVDIIKRGIDEGMNLIDTCEAYNNGMSERVVGKAISGSRHNVFVLTKFKVENSSYKDVIKACEGSLRRLNTHYIDIYQMHWPSSSVLFDETIKAMMDLMDSGKVLSIGVGNATTGHDLEKMYRISGGRITSYQTEYNLFDRWAETEFFPFCKNKGMEIIAYSPIDRGRMGNGENQLQVLREIATKYDMAVSQVVLNWMVNKHGVIPIPKATNIKHLLYNAHSLSFNIDDDDINRIDNECLTKISYIDPARIKVTLGGQDNRKTYTTLNEAIENKLGFCPSPVELSHQISGKSVKPVRLVKVSNKKYDYELVEGRIRYWAWVISGNNGGVPSLIRENF